MKLWIIAKSNLRQKKTDMTVLLLMVVLSTTLLYASVSVFLKMDSVLNQTREKTNGAQHFLATTSQDSREIMKVIKNRSEVMKVQMTECLRLSETMYYNKKDGSAKPEQLEFLMSDMEEERSISKLMIQDKASIREANSIVLPYYMKVALGYETGDILCLKNKDQIVECRVYGFTENVMFASPSNASVFRCYTTVDILKELESGSGVNAVKEYNTVVNPGVDLADYEDDIMDALTEQVPDFLHQNNMTWNFDTMKIGASMTVNILMAIIIIFGMMIIMIAVILIRFSIINSIERNMKNIGVLQAGGYTAKQLVAGTVSEVMGVTLVGIFVGIIFSALSMNGFGNLVASAMGISWKQGFSPDIVVMNSLFIMLAVLGVVVFTTRRYAKITPLHALREGFATHNFKGNSIPLDRTPLGLNITLGIKNIWQDKRKNLAVCGIAFFLALTCCVGLGVYDNFAASQEKLLEISGMEVPDASVVLTGAYSENPEEVGEKLKALEETEAICYRGMNNLLVSSETGEETILFESFDRPDLLRIDTLVEGAWPVYDNELILSNAVCEELKASIGDVMYLELNGVRKDYLLTGITQHISMLGRKGVTTLDGLKRLSKDAKPTWIYAYGKPGMSYKELEEAYKEVLPGITVIDDKAGSEVALASISGAMTAMCILFVVCSMGIVGLVIYFLAKSKLIRERKQMGIWKALGFSTRQLIAQTMISYVPVILLGAILGVIGGYFAINPIVVMALAFCKIKELDLELRTVYMVITVVGMGVTAALVSGGCALRIRKIEAFRMIQE